jgi:hypothetical protein
VLGEKKKHTAADQDTAHIESYNRKLRQSSSTEEGQTLPGKRRQRALLASWMGNNKAFMFGFTGRPTRRPARRSRVKEWSPPLPPPLLRRTRVELSKALRKAVNRRTFRREGTSNNSGGAATASALAVRLHAPQRRPRLVLRVLTPQPRRRARPLPQLRQPLPQQGRVWTKDFQEMRRRRPQAAAAFADDVIIVSRGRNAHACTLLLQTAIDTALAWAT